LAWSLLILKNKIVKKNQMLPLLALVYCRLTYTNSQYWLKSNKKVYSNFRSWDNFYCIWIKHFQYGNQNAFGKPLLALSRGTSVDPLDLSDRRQCENFLPLQTIRLENDKYAAFTNAIFFPQPRPFHTIPKRPKRNRKIHYKM
jgi:hypothetical protein